jgi:hypothetical protein
MLLVVAGMRSWSDSAGLAKKYSLEHKSVSNDITQGNPTLPEGDQAKVSTLSLNAVITPAISFDFSHYFYFLPQPVWDFVQDEFCSRVAFKESFFLFSYFRRVFGKYIVTNAP